MKLQVTRWLWIMAMLLVAGGAAAAELKLTEAENLIRAGKYAEAYSLLEPFEFEEAGNVSYDYLLGTAALNSGMPGKATLVFERVLAVEPRYVGVRADIGRAYFAIGDYGRAKIEFETILVLQNLPPDIRATAQQYLNAIAKGEDAQLTSYTSYVDMGIGYDSNVNSSTRQSPILFTAYNFLYFPDPTTLPRSDSYSSLSLGGEVNRKLNANVAVFGGVDLRARMYTQYTASNYSSLDGRAGLSYSEGAHLMRLWGNAGRLLVASSPSRDNTGVNGEWRYAMDSSNQLSLNAQYEQFRFVNPTLVTEDYNQTTLGAGLMHAFGDGKSALTLNVGGGAERDINGRADGGKRFTNVRVGGQSALSDSVGVFASIGAMASRFDRQNANFLLYRKDDFYDITLGTNIRVYKTWSLRPQLSYIQSQSNVPFYKFDKTDFSINLRSDF